MTKNYCASTYSAPVFIDPRECLYSEPILIEPYLNSPLPICYTMRQVTSSVNLIIDMTAVSSGGAGVTTIVGGGNGSSLLYVSSSKEFSCCNDGDLIINSTINIDISFISVNIEDDCSVGFGSIGCFPISNPEFGSDDGLYPNTICHYPDRTICWTKDDPINIPLKITVKLGPQISECYSSQFQDLIKKYTNANLYIKGFIAHIERGRTIHAKVGSDITNINSVNISGNAGSNEKKSDSNSNIRGSLRDSVNTQYYFLEDKFAAQRFRMAKSYYMIIQEDSTNKNFVRDDGASVYGVQSYIYVHESFDNKLYFSMRALYFSNLYTDGLYQFESDLMQVNSINDFYNLISLRPLDNIGIDYQLVELYD
jgi:hypothetical protein